MRRLVFAELVVLLAAALLLPVVICCRRSSGGATRPLPVSEQPGAGANASRKERRVERLRRALHALRVWCRRSRVEPAASASASPDDGAQAQGEVQLEQIAAPAAAAEQAGHEEEGVAAWRERWFGGPGSRALYTIEEASETEGDVESQYGAEPETPFYTPPASPPHDGEQADQPEHGEAS
ncbi:hypothetical protein CFC21_038455 [Triticum aestivum]|uniref:Uncharacterized protein n=2 Tax=Triticum aestivum TaxID=4565 RepID=A0A3B6EUZ8_WHEAT|nr:uncharacterized protein LOC123059567 [Triticum aestivum]KAF7026344.1 hypothetical protein CFC21_038455 [Triticum aestivum]